MLLYIKGKEHDKLLLDLVLNGPFQYGTMVEPGNETTPATIRARTYTDLTDEEKIHETVDIKATNIVLHGLELSLQERESKLYDDFDTFTFMPEETIHSYYMRFAQLINDMHTIGDNRDIVISAQASQEIPTLAAFQTDDLDAFNSDCDDVPSSKVVLMANLSSYDSNVLSEVPFHDTNIENDMSYQKTENLVVQNTSSFAQQDELLMFVIEEMSSQVTKCNKVQQENLIVNETLTTELERYKEQVKIFEQRKKFDLNDREKYINGQLRKVIVDRNAKVADFEKQIHSLKLQLNATVESHKTLTTPVECSKKESKQKEDKYLGEFIDLQKKNKALDNVVYKMSQSTQTMHMLTKPQALYDTHDALYVIDTEETLELAEESRAYYLQDVMNTVMHANDHSDNVLPTNHNSLEHDNSALELLKHENDRLMELLISQDLVHTTVNSLAAINDYKSMQQSFMDQYNETLVLKAELAKNHDMIEKAVYNELSKRCSRLENQCISLEIKLQQNKESFQNNRPSHYQDAPEFKEFFIINELQAQLKAKNVSIEKLKEHIANIKGMNVVESVQNGYNSNVVTLKVYKLDLQPLSSLVKHNWNAHVDYLKHTQENANTLHEIIKHARELRLLDSDLDFTYKFVTLIQELLVYGSATCPNSKPVSKKLVAVTPINMDRKVSDYLNDVNARVKSKSMKSISTKSKKKEMWKPTGKVYTKVGYIWKPIGWTFTIVGNTCPLTRIISTKVVPPRKSISTTPVVQIVLLYLDSSCSKHMTGQRSQLINFLSKFLGTLRFGNDQIEKIIDLEVAFRKHTCYVRNIDDADLLSGSRDINLYTISLDDILKSSLICLLSKASKTKSWLWHRRLSHLNFVTLNELAKQGLVRGLPKLKFKKDHICLACSLGKSKKSSHKLKADDTNQEKLYLLHMDLCGPMHVESINGKKYILVIIDDYSRFTWVKFLRSKDEAPETLREYYENVRISHQTSVASTPQQNNVAEAVNTACYTQNRSLIRPRYNKTPYKLIHDKKPDLSYRHVFGSMCYSTNDSEDLGKLKAKADIGIFVGYAPVKKAFCIYNKRTRLIMETIHVTFDELTLMASKQFSSRPAP
ncbi:retrovirus-related pol polyprotein from transposon TNT 1-94 [Tanacetum coccineum]